MHQSPFRLKDNVRLSVQVGWNFQLAWNILSRQLDGLTVVSQKKILGFLRDVSGLPLAC